MTPARGRKIKTMGGKKKDEVPKSEPPPPPERPLQTTNEVKAQLISANMIKGDMIITKPGENRNNQQKVMFVQRHVVMKANELKSLALKKPVVVSKGKVVNQVAVKSPVPVKEQLVKPPVVPAKETVKPVVSTHGQPKIISVVQLPVQAHLNLGQKMFTKVKVPEVKKSRRKSESGTSETVPVTETETEKPLEVKTPETPGNVCLFV